MNYLTVLQNRLQGMTSAAVALLPSIAIAIVILVIAWLVARFATSIVHRVTGRTRLRSDLKDLLETLVRVAIWVVGFLLAATIVIPGFTFGGMIAGLGIGAVAIGFAFQDIFKNFLAGILIMLREKMHIGDTIWCEEIEGKVEHISLRETHIRQFNGELTIVPNSMLFEKPVRIVTDTAVWRDEIVIPIDPDCDLEQARDAIEGAVKSVEAIQKDRDVQVYVRRFNEAGAVEFLARWWVDASSTDKFAVRSAVLVAITRALAEAGIALPTATTELVTSDSEPLSIALRAAR